MGAWFGDGSLALTISKSKGTLRPTIVLVVKDKEFAEEWARCAAIINGRPRPYTVHIHKYKSCRRRYSKDIHLYEVDFRNTLLYHILNTRDPWFIAEVLRLTETLEVVAKTLKGFFDAEGDVARRDIRAYNSNKELLSLIQHFLQLLGIESRIYIHRRTKNQKTHYVLVIYRKQSILLFYQIVNFIIVRKRRRLEQLVNTLQRPKRRR